MSERRPSRYRLAWRDHGGPWRSVAFVYRNHRDRRAAALRSADVDVRAWDVLPLR